LPFLLIFANKKRLVKWRQAGRSHLPH